MRPKWMRRHVSCPECGYIYDIDGGTSVKGALCLNRAMPPIRNEKTGNIDHPNGFTCLKCHAHFPAQDFWEENHEKWNREAAPDFQDPEPLPIEGDEKEE